MCGWQWKQCAVFVRVVHLKCCGDEMTTIEAINVCVRSWEWKILCMPPRVCINELVFSPCRMQFFQTNFFPDVFAIAHLKSFVHLHSEMMKNDTHSMIKIVQKMNVTCVIWIDTCKWTGCFLVLCLSSICLLKCSSLFFASIHKETALFSCDSVFCCFVFVFFSIFAFAANCCFMTFEHFEISAGGGKTQTIVTCGHRD